MAPKHVDPTSAAPKLISRDADEQLSTDGDSVDLAELMASMPLQERRCVYALKHYYTKTKEVRRNLHTELAALEKEKGDRLQELHKKRLAIISGEREVTEEDIKGLPPLVKTDERPAEEKKGVKTASPSDEARKQQLLAAAQSAAGGIPAFWLSCLSHHDALSALITEKDRPILQTITNIATSYINDSPMDGVRIHFYFSETVPTAKGETAPNPYLDATQGPLTIAFKMELDEDSDERVVSSVEGCDIPWRSDAVNPTVVIKKRKQRNKNTKEMRVVERAEPCESFFNIFKSIKVPGDEEDDENEDEDLFDMMDMNIEAGQAIIDEIVPKAAFYYSGRSVDKIAEELLNSLGMGNWNGEEDEEEESEEEDDQAPRGNFKAMLNNGMGGANRKAGQAPQQQQQQDCKQQ